MLPIKKDREFSSLRHMFGHQAEDAFVTVEEQVRAEQLRKAGDDTDGRQRHEADPCASPHCSVVGHLVKVDAVGSDEVIVVLLPDDPGVGQIGFAHLYTK